MNGPDPVPPTAAPSAASSAPLPDATPAPPARQQLRALRDGLLDLRFERLITPNLLPTVYTLAVLACGAGVLAFVAEGFARTLASGLLRLALAPIAFVVLVTAVRMALELVLVVFRIGVNLSTMVEHTGEIAGSLPRLQFWKGFFGSGRSRPPE